MLLFSFKFEGEVPEEFSARVVSRYVWIDITLLFTKFTRHLN
jgi:hypothetical protein